MEVFVFDMDGTLTPARKPMTTDFEVIFLPWLKSNQTYLATGSDIDKVKEQLSLEVINSFSGIFCSMGNIFWQKGKYVYSRDFEPEEELIRELEHFRAHTQYPFTLYPNYIEKRIGAINFCVLGRDCPYEERLRYSLWDKEHMERLYIQGLLSQKFPEYDFSLGGAVSIDVVKKGCGKEQIAKELRNRFPNEKIIFFGDKTFEGGNDYELASALQRYSNTQIVQVSSPDDVLNFLKIR